MATFRPVARNIATTPENVSQYLAYLDELAKLRRPTDVATGFTTDRTPTAFSLPQTRGVQQVTPGTQVTTPITPYSTIAPVYATSTATITSEDSNKPRSIDVLEKVVKASLPEEVSRDANGNIYYSNNTIRDVTGVTYNAQTGQVISVEPEIIQVKDGYAITRDGQILKYTQDLYKPTGTASRDIQSMLFGGQQYSITQPYGVYNPNAYYTYHKGLDIAGTGEWKVPISLPFGATVVNRLYDGQNDMGYGNSVLVKLPSGEMLRFSHLSESGLKPGDQIKPGQTIGFTGTTGNSSGYHLDLEYYDENGQVQNPYQFVNKVAQQPENYQINRYTNIDYKDVNPNIRQEAFRWKVAENKVTPEDRQNFPNEVKTAEQNLQSTNQNLQTQIDQRIQQEQQPSILSTATQKFNLPSVGYGEISQGDVLGASKELAGTAIKSLSGIAQKAGIQTPEYGVTEALARNYPEAVSKFASAMATGQTDFENIISQGKQLAQEKLQGLFGGRPITQTATQETPVEKTLSSQLDVKSALDNAKGLLTQIGTMQPGDFSKTQMTGLQGLIPKAYAQESTAIPYGAKPIGQTGFAGSALVTGEQPKTSLQTQQSIATQEQKTQTNVPYSQEKSTPYMSTQIQKVNVSKPSSKSTSQTKQPTKAVTKPQVEVSKSVSQTKLQPMSRQTQATPYTSGTKTIYGVKVQQQTNQQSKAPTTLEKPIQKQNVFKKAVSKISSFLKKK